MTQPEAPAVLRDRKLEVIRTRQRLPEGPERDALDAYSQQLFAQLRDHGHEPARDVTRDRALTRALAPKPEPAGLGIGL